jgi:hypothetical protein
VGNTVLLFDLFLQLLQGIEALITQVAGCVDPIELLLDSGDVDIDALQHMGTTLGDQGGIDLIHRLDQRLDLFDHSVGRGCVEDLLHSLESRGGLIILIQSYFRSGLNLKTREILSPDGERLLDAHRRFVDPLRHLKNPARNEKTFVSVQRQRPSLSAKDFQKLSSDKLMRSTESGRWLPETKSERAFRLARLHRKCKNKCNRKGRR